MTAAQWISSLACGTVVGGVFSVVLRAWLNQRAEALRWREFQRRLNKMPSLAPSPGTLASVRYAIEQVMPAAYNWAVRSESSPDLEPGQIRVVIKYGLGERR